MESKYAGMSPYNYSFNNPVMWNDPSGADPGKPPIEEASKKLIGNPKPVDENVLEYINPDGSFTGEQANIHL